MHVETTRCQGKERQVLGAERGNKRRKKKIPGGRSANTDRKRRVGSLTGTGRAGKQEREGGGGLTTHTEEARLRVGVVQERASVGRGMSRVTWDNGKERISRVTWDNRKERIQKDFLARLLQFLHKKPPKLGSEHRQKRGAWDFLHNTKLGSNLQLQ